MEIPIDDPTQIALHKEMLLEASNDNWLVKLETEFLDFNYCEFGRASEHKEIVITNKFSFPVLVKLVSNDIVTNTGATVPNPF